MIGFVYDDLSDTQDGLVFENGIYILWLTSSPHDKDSGERPRSHGPSYSRLMVI